MIKNKVFILFRMKLLILTLFFLFIPFLFSANASSLDNNRYKVDFTENSASGAINFLTITQYSKHTNYLPKCADDFTGPEWTSYPYTTNMPQNITCLPKNYCSDLDENGELIVQSPGVDEYGNPNCYRKSCLDLTTEELKVIFKRQYGIDADAYFSTGYTQLSDPNFYKFCEPYNYINLSLGNNTYVPIINVSSPIYCHMFGKSELKYLIPDVRKLKDSETNSIDVYQCLIHQCPLTLDQSATCPTNFWLFSYKINDNRCRSNDYITEYEDKLLGGAGDIVGTQITNYCSSVQCAKNKFTKWLSCQITLNSECQTCIQKINSYNCGECVTEILNEPSCNGCYSFIPNTQCDTYKGLDNNFINNSFYNNLKNALLYYNGSQQTCSTEQTCQQSTDCSLPENVNNISCIQKDSTSGTADPSLSYFYRPFPSQEATEILPVKREWIINGTLAEHIYGNDYNEDNILNNTNSGDLTYVTVIKRSLRGAPIQPKPENKTISRDLKNISLNFSNINSYKKNFFNYIDNNSISDKNRNNICMPNNDDFKHYSFRKANLTSDTNNKWDEGEYYYRQFTNSLYSGDFTTTQSITNVPLCDINDTKTTVSSYTGRESFCTLNYDNSACKTPRSDSYYIKGTPVFDLSSSTSDVKSLTVDVCLRRRSTKKGTFTRRVGTGSRGGPITLTTTYNICGERECFIKCSDNNCTDFTQTCGEDTCVTLTWYEGDNCTIAELDKLEKVPACAKVILQNGYGDGYNGDIPNAIRFRLNRHANKKFYVYVDAANEKSCGFWGIGDEHKELKLNNKKVTRTIENELGLKTFTITEYKGKITDQNLLDDNSLINYVVGSSDKENTENTENTAEYITDQDVFGEELHDHFQCGEDHRNEDECNSRSSGVQEGVGNWFTWDIVQYIGNNQPTENNPNCKVGQLLNCRGYYDAEGKFHREQQGISAPLAISPDFFYRYATKENSPNIFTPLLKIRSAVTKNGNYNLKYTKEDDEIELDFFEPTLSFTYELTEKNNVKVSFKDMEFEDTVEDSKGKYTQDFVLRKTIENIDGVQPKVCLIKVFKIKGDTDSDLKVYEEVVKCFKRQKPDLQSIVIKTKYNNNDPYLEAYFINKNNIDKTSKISLNDMENIIQFKRSDSNLSTEDQKKLIDNSTAFAQKYPINIEKSYCSDIHYECIKYKKDLSNAQLQYKMLVENGATESDVSTLNNNIVTLNGKINVCDNIITTYCNNLTDGTILFKEAIGTTEKSNAQLSQIYSNYINNIVNIRLCTLNNNCSDYLQNIIDQFNEEYNKGNIAIKIYEQPQNYNLNPSTNNICIVSGFDSYFPNVMAVASPTLQQTGKCILDTESKLKEECRRKYYVSYCTNNADPECLCIDGTAECNCTYGNTCVKKNFCECSENEGDVACDSLPEECYLPGYNGEGIILSGVNDINNVVDQSCKCEYNTNGLARTGMEIRKATPGELGLCTNINNMNFCKPIKYYNEEKKYIDGGEGQILDIIQGQYYSNIWRTNQIQYGKFKNNNLEHAEFDLSTYTANDNQYTLEDIYCVDIHNNGYYYLLKQDCFEKYLECKKEQESQQEENEQDEEDEQNKDDECQKSYDHCIQHPECASGYMRVYAKEGECNGFWKNKVVTDEYGNTYNLNPLATCQSDGYFKLVNSNFGCERYSCPTKLESQLDYATNEEKRILDVAETTPINVSNIGKSNGFANWDSYKKGTYNIITGEISTDNIENGHGDDIEQRTASSCITGYAPAGFGTILKKYYPVPLRTIIDKESGENIIVIDDRISTDLFVKNMLLENEHYISTDSMKNTLLLVNGEKYDAREHLPVRYCNQIGEWMPVLDIYNRFGIDPYYIGSLAYSNLNNGFINVNLYATKNNAISETNTYGQYVNYSQKYCERLFCNGISISDIPDIENEDNDNINNAKSYNIDAYNIKYFDNNELNKYTVWRHAGGATWPETPTSLSGDSVSVTGTCYNKGGYYPNDTEFLSDIFTYNNNDVFFSSFEKQYNLLFEQSNNTSTVDPRDLNLISNISSVTNPTRECNKYGVWDEIHNKCVRVCEPLDPFRTNYYDANNDGKIQSTEILSLYKIPHINNQYYVDNNGKKEGDKYTGGARWGRTLAGQYAIGECDSTISYGTQIYKNNSLTTSTENIIFVNGGDPNYTSTPFPYDIGGRPYRECLPDGTWGPVHNPCILYNETCGSKKIYNRDISNNSNNSIVTNNIVATLSSSSIIIDDVEDNSSQNINVTVETSCDSRYYTGKVSQQCNINTQSWTGTINSSCDVKTCDAYSESINNIEFISIPKDLYYMKDTGFKGALYLNNHTYIDYQVSQECPEYYECINCQNNNKVQYTCEYDSSINQPSWKSSGECRPISCNFNDLITYCNNSNICVVDATANENNIIDMPETSPLIDLKEKLDEVVFTSSTTKYDRENNLFAVGSHIRLLPGIGFKENKLSYAYCNMDGSWYTIIDFENVKCDDTTLDNTNNKSWENASIGKCADGSQDYNCPGAMKKAVCGTTQSEGKQTAICTQNKDGTASWVYEGELQCYEGCSLKNVNISFNNVSCLCPTNIPELGYECSTSQTTCVDLVNLNYNLGDTIDHSASTIKTISNVNGIAGITAEIELNCTNGAIDYRLMNANQIKCNCYNGCTGLISELPCNN